MKVQLRTERQRPRKSRPTKQRLPNACFRLYFKLPFYLLAGALTGLALAILRIQANPQLAPEPGLQVFVLCNVGWLIALVVWYLEFCCVRKLIERGRAGESKKKAREAHLPTVNQPAPYQDRLSKFLDCEQEELAEPREQYVSRMPFWSRFNFWSRSAPKSASTIRRLLRRIQKVVQGGK